MKVEVAVLGSSTLTVLMVCECKATLNLTKNVSKNSVSINWNVSL